MVVVIFGFKVFQINVFMRENTSPFSIQGKHISIPHAGKLFNFNFCILGILVICKFGSPSCSFMVVFFSVKSTEMWKMSKKCH